MFEEEMNINQNEVKKGNGLKIFLIIALIIVFMAMVGVLAYMSTITDTSLKVYIDGERVAIPEGILLFEDKIYVDIKGIAPYLNYSAHNGEYKIFSEDTNKCYVDNKNETASFFLNSNKISKVIPDQTKDYEDYTIKDLVVKKNGKLYSSVEGIKIGFNVNFDYDQVNNQITIFTLPYLVEYYDPILEEQGYEGVSDNFFNQKAILYNMFVLKKKDGGLYGVTDLQGNEIISSKYEKMVFNESLQEFFVTSTVNKMGVVTSSAETKIDLNYEEISMLDKDNNLYLAKKDGKYGVLNKTGNIIVHFEYNTIGINSGNFQTDNIKNKYLLFNNTIPVMQNGKWGAFDIKGKKIIPVEYDFIGYIASEQGNSGAKVANNLLIIPNYKAIVLGKQFKEDNKTINKYALIDYQGKELVQCLLDSAYSVTNAGENTYYMEYNNQEINIEQYIDKFYEVIYGVPKPSLNGNNYEEQQNTNEITSNTTTNSINIDL